MIKQQHGRHNYSDQTIEKLIQNSLSRFTESVFETYFYWNMLFRLKKLKLLDLKKVTTLFFFQKIRGFK
jgi:hypothetical protein